MAKTRTSMSQTNQPFISIVPPQGWGKLALPELWEYRERLNPKQSLGTSVIYRIINFLTKLCNQIF
ncbi:hypothetical protein PN36_11465 [Candidatus Thiomargarita nelsonii]|uniref:Uncharacterized protein n=1 Tax=Candidatus Thiomargarita nelsonii TaxID=1003181 RepID=A0A0A6P5D3_9GAMM|nr:hypothetical protein PN36_11465 [Candidatus Thiomargarita nelsonii]